MTIVAINGINQPEVNATFDTVFEMNCSVESYPTAMIQWEENGVQVGNNTEMIKGTNVHEAVRVNTSIPGAIITYTCVAVNVINEVVHIANNSVNVIIQGKILCDEYA